jgi:hypothetical protein
MKRLLLTVVLLAGMVALVPAAGGPSATFAQTAENQTRVRQFVPFSIRGLSPSLTVTSQVNGNCWTGSVADAGRADAWRCMAGNAIYDPCFQPGATPGVGGQVACAQTPWSGSVVLLTLTEPLPEMANQANPNALPWALELTNGKQCSFAGGATGVVAGQRINYTCQGGGLVAGAPDRSLALWSVQYLDSIDSSSTLEVDVATAWQ